MAQARVPLRVVGQEPLRIGFLAGKVRELN